MTAALRLLSGACRSLYNAGYYRGLVEGLALGALGGGLMAACALALAWSHVGG